MKRILLLIATCVATIGLSAQDVNITFNVNTTGIAGPVDVIQLAGGGNFGNPGDNPLADPDGDGVYTITITREAGFSSFYTFTNGPCPDYSCKEDISGQVCADPNNFNDRFLPAVSQDTVINTCFGQCTTDTVCAPPPSVYDVTFQLDLRGFTDTFTTPGVVGTFNGFNGQANPMTDADGDSIWTATIAITEGPIEFKYQLDNYAIQETLTGNQPCAMAFGAFVNRVDTITADVVFDPVCLGSCLACDAEPVDSMVAITFNVGTAGIAGTVNTIQVAGGGNFGNPGDNPMTDDDGDGIYTITLMRPVGFTSFYTFTNGPCPDYSCKEDISGQACANPANFNDRLMVNVTQDTVINTCFGQCTDDTNCAPPPAQYSVTFQLDLRTFAEEFTQPYVFGTFNGFDALANPLDDMDGDSIWTTTVVVNEGPIEFKYHLDNFAFDEMLTADQACAMAFGDMGQFVNRVDTILADVVLNAVCFNSCDACITTSTNDIADYGIEFSLRPTLVNESLTLDLRQPNALRSTVQLISTDGRLLETRQLNGTTVETVDVSNLTSGIYYVRLLHGNASAIRRFIKQ